MNQTKTTKHASRAGTYGALLLLLVGLLQMTGDILKLPLLKGFGAATMISPAPKVFTSVRGLESFSTNYYLEFNDKDGQRRTVKITSELYAQIAGPYNRRNIYGAVLAFGPVLYADPKARPMFESVSKYALCGNAPLLRELGIDPATVAGPVVVRYELAEGVRMDAELRHELEVGCR